MVSAATGVIAPLSTFLDYLLRTNGLQNLRIIVLEASVSSLPGANLNSRLAWPNKVWPTSGKGCTSLPRGQCDMHHNWCLKSGLS